MPIGCTLFVVSDPIRLSLKADIIQQACYEVEGKTMPYEKRQKAMLRSSLGYTYVDLPLSIRVDPSWIGCHS